MFISYIDVRLIPFICVSTIPLSLCVCVYVRTCTEMNEWQTRKVRLTPTKDPNKKNTYTTLNAHSPRNHLTSVGWVIWFYFGDGVYEHTHYRHHPPTPHHGWKLNWAEVKRCFQLYFRHDNKLDISSTLHIYVQRQFHELRAFLLLALVSHDLTLLFIITMNYTVKIALFILLVDQKCSV